MWNKPKTSPQLPSKYPSPWEMLRRQGKMMRILGWLCEQWREPEPASIPAGLSVGPYPLRQHLRKPQLLPIQKVLGLLHMQLVQCATWCACTLTCMHPILQCTDYACIASFRSVAHVSEGHAGLKACGMSYPQWGGHGSLLRHLRGQHSCWIGMQIPVRPRYWHAVAGLDPSLLAAGPAPFRICLPGPIRELLLRYLSFTRRDWGE